MNHTPKWRTWEGGAGNIWVGYADEASGFQIPRAEILYKGTLGGTKEEAVVLGQEMAIALNAYPALVTACRAAYDLDIAQDAYDADDLVEAKDVFAAWGLSSLDPDDALRELRAQVSTLLRDALAAAGEDQPQAISDPLPLPDSTIQEEA